MNFPGEGLIIRIWDTVEKSVSAGLRPKQILREEAARTEARRRELLVAAQALNDAEDIRAGKAVLQGNAQPKLLAQAEGDVGKLVRQQATNTEMLLEIAMADQAATRLEHLANLKRTATFAEEEAERLTDEGMSHDRSIDEDWFERWRGFAEKVSDKDVQRLWARALAGEAKHPGTYSLRTLNFLSTITKEDAEIIETLASFVVGAGVLLSQFDEFYNNNGLPFTHRIHLQDVGVLGEGGSLFGPQMTFQAQSVRNKFCVIVENNGIALLLFSDQKKELKLTASPLTRVGRELMSFTKAAPSVDFLKEVAKEARSKGFSEARIGNVDTKSGGIYGDFPFDF